MPEHLRGVDAVVVNYRTPLDLARHLRSWRDYPPSIDFDLRLVNVAPGEGDRAVADTARGVVGPWFAETISTEDNVGYGRACNAGAAAGKREVILLLNADTALRADVVDACYGALVDHEDWAVVGPRQVDGAGRLTAAGIFGTDSRAQHRAWLAPDSPRYGDVRPDAVTVAGSAYFIRRSVWDQLTDCPIYREVVPDAAGAFLPTPLFYEETWCSVHARAHGWCCTYYGPAVMTHHWHRSVKANRVPRQRMMAEAHEMFRTACDAHGIAHD